MDRLLGGLIHSDKPETIILVTYMHMHNFYGLGSGRTKQGCIRKTHE